ncbi:MAG TPA: glycosyltransferase family 2 protein [Lacipirellulaceae bacterium]|nr:glycosyltransferase family 2 protein [Lacipirellulaceae bacterium]
MHGDDRIAVVIPFYQRERGILIKTVRSALEQQGVKGVHIVVVDDESPVSAVEELSGLQQEAGDRLTIVRQANKGAAGARNTGLDSVPPNTDFIALLDSDDIWTPNHLANAMSAMERGYDFYFSDFYHLGQSVTAFQRARRINVADHPLIAGLEHIREYTGNMVNQIITGNILGTSVIVYDRKNVSDVRFRESFQHTGEEYIFLIDLARRSRKIAFSDLPECRYGAGVNIYSSSWGQEKFLSVIVDEVKYRKAIMRDYDTTDFQRKLLEDRIRKLRIDFTAGLIHRLKINRGSIDRAVLRRYVQVDKGYPIMIWPAIVRLIYEKMSPSGKRARE